MTPSLERGLAAEQYGYYLELSLGALVYVPMGRWDAADDVLAHGEPSVATNRLVWLWLVTGLALRRGDLELVDPPGEGGGLLAGGVRPLERVVGATGLTLHAGLGLGGPGRGGDHPGLEGRDLAVPADQPVGHRGGELGVLGRARMAGELEGFVKIVADRKYDEVLGVHMIGPRSTELVAEAVLALRLECTVEELIKTIHAHPTFSEAVGEAAHAAHGAAIHM